MSDFPTLMELERERLENSFHARVFYGAVMKRTRNWETHLRMKRREEEATRVSETDPRLTALGPWDRKVLQTVHILDSFASDTRILSRLQKQGNEMLTAVALRRSLGRLAAAGVIERATIEVKDTTQPGWRFIPEEK